MFCLLVSFPTQTLFPGWCANKSYVIATADLWLFILAPNLLPSTPHPAPLQTYRPARFIVILSNQSSLLFREGPRCGRYNDKKLRTSDKAVFRVRLTDVTRCLKDRMDWTRCLKKIGACLLLTNQSCSERTPSCQSRSCSPSATRRRGLKLGPSS